MKPIMLTIVYISLVSLPSIVSGQIRGQEKTLYELLKTVNDIAANDKETINDIFKPSIGGLLGMGALGFTYKGKLLPNNKDVAMKFTLQEYWADAEQEYEIYTCLGAIDDATVENFGIPAVYYYSRWYGHVMIALTLLDPEFNSKFEKCKLNDADIMILFREFVRIFKYIHSRGVCHQDFKIDNLMVDKDHAFIIDYNSAIKMYENSNSEFSHGVHNEGMECAIGDLKDFLAVMCHHYGINFDWFSYQNTTKQIERIEHDGLKRIYLEFAKMIFTTKVPNYNGLVKIINGEIKSCTLPKTEWFSWLEADRRMGAIVELVKNWASILSVSDPFKIDRFRYPEVKFNYFDKQNQNRLERENSVSD